MAYGDLHEDGRKCKARFRPCPLLKKGELHFKNAEEFEAHYNNIYGATQSSLTPEEIERANRKAFEDEMAYQAMRLDALDAKLAKEKEEYQKLNPPVVETEEERLAKEKAAREWFEDEVAYQAMRLDALDAKLEADNGRFEAEREEAQRVQAIRVREAKEAEAAKAASILKASLEMDELFASILGRGL